MYLHNKGPGEFLSLPDAKRRVYMREIYTGFDHDAAGTFLFSLDGLVVSSSNCSLDCASAGVDNIFHERLDFISVKMDSDYRHHHPNNERDVW